MAHETGEVCILHTRVVPTRITYVYIKALGTIKQNSGIFRCPKLFNGKLICMLIETNDGWVEWKLGGYYIENRIERNRA